MYGPKLFPLAKMKHEYSDILYNLTHFLGSWPFGSDELKMKYKYQDILLQFKIWDYLDMMFKTIWYLNTTDIFPIADLILKLYVFIPSYFPYKWFSPGTPASSTTKTGRHEIAEILLKVALIPGTLEG
jgi:hypothetical protein